jgi:hypothetical protein
MMATPTDLTPVENAIRSLIQDVLAAEYGDAWDRHLGVTPERIAKWRERRTEAEARSVGGVVEERVIFYADFTDLRTIIGKQSNWPLFQRCFRDKRRFEVYLERLEELRNPAAHSRSILPFEKHLAEGISGELLQMITLFRNLGGAGAEPEHFARIEEVTDSFGHRGKGRASGQESVDTRDQITVRPGDKLRFTGSARDPKGRPLQWTIRALFGAFGSFDHGVVPADSFDVEWEVIPQDINEQQEIDFTLKSVEGPHRYANYDDMFRFIYKVLPPL